MAPALAPCGPDRTVFIRKAVVQLCCAVKDGRDDTVPGLTERLACLNEKALSHVEACLAALGGKATPSGGDMAVPEDVVAKLHELAPSV